MRLTKNSIAALATDKPDQVFWDDTLPGFGVRLRGATKRWIIQYRVGQQQRRESLGDIRKVTLDDARRVARQRFAQIELGTDPAADRAKARAAAATAKLTLGSVAERYLDAKRDIMRPNSYRDTRRYFASHWQPLRDWPLADIKRADVAARLQELAKTNGRVSAARARANLSALYSWATREGLVEFNPCLGTNDPGAGIKPRERVLADHELATVWNACADDDFGRIVKLLILTGARRHEIGGLLWSDINFDTGVLSVPGSRTKSGRTLELALPPVALDILRSTPRRRDHVFGTRGIGFSSWSTFTAAMKRRITTTMASWSLHDIRRSMRTGLGRLGVQPHIAEMVINHAKGGVEAIYDRGRYEREKRAALALWADHVLAVVERRDEKVVPLIRGS